MVRVLLSGSLLLFYLRLLFVLSVLESMGPKLKMISDMVIVDLLPFLSVLLVFMLAFGVVFQALLYPNGKGHHRQREGNDFNVSHKANLTMGTMEVLQNMILISIK